MAEAESEQQQQLLGVVLDIHPRQLSALYGDAKVFFQCLDGVMAFCNAYLVMSAKNRLAVVAADATSCEFVYTGEQQSRESSGKEDGQYELLSLVDSSIKTAIKNMYHQSSQEQRIQPESLVPAALAKMLCYFNRCQKELEAGQRLIFRVLLVTASSDSMLQYMAYMNTFFTAQKMGVMIDCCMIGEGSGLIQQGCDITSGVYLKIPQVAGLLQYLLVGKRITNINVMRREMNEVIKVKGIFAFTGIKEHQAVEISHSISCFPPAMVFLPDASVRDKLLMPPPVRVDYRSACFCHRNLVDIGYVCSVCLSIFCKFSPICSTCHTVFKHDKLPVPAKTKKRKLKP